MRSLWIISAVICLGIVLAGGCVERKLTIVTTPADAVVWLNDEEIGQTPVTVNFNWYGEYRVRIEKPGYEIVNSHNTMKRPLHDVFPFDFFAECLWPGRIVDSYTWTYELAAYQPASAEQLIQQAQEAQNRFTGEIDIAKQQINAVKTEKK
ncbi:MAG: PEGA domain-containing protein [Anaerohalosphaeraceae bacterium]